MVNVPGEHVEFKYRNKVIAGEVYGRFERHGL